MSNLFEYKNLDLLLKPNTNYTNCSFVGSNLSFLNLTQCNFTNCNFTNSICIGTNFTNCNLSQCNFTNANLSDSNFHNSDLSGAYLTESNLENCKGNMKEIKTASFEKWALVWIKTFEGEDILQVGCQKNTGAKWKKSNIRLLQKIHPDAAEWFEKYSGIMSTLLDISPAMPHGQKPL
jgi:uncharacterized protein YjbI with pentapeptide repeats